MSDPEWQASELEPEAAAATAAAASMPTSSGNIDDLLFLIVDWKFFDFECVYICDFRLVDWANFFKHPSKGQTYGRSPEKRTATG